MKEVSLDGRSMLTTQECLTEIFRALEGLIPDYGGRNLDALIDDLLELSEPVTVRWKDSEVSKAALFGWFDRVVSTLAEHQEARAHQLTLILE